MFRGEKVGHGACVEPGPEVRKVREDVGASTFWYEAVVGEHDDGGGAVDKGDEEAAEPICVKAVARYLVLF
jgi:hypothetical protein